MDDLRTIEQRMRREDKRKVFSCQTIVECPWWTDDPRDAFMSAPTAEYRNIIVPGQDDRHLMCAMCRAPVMQSDRDNFFEVWRKADEDKQAWRTAGYHKNWLATKVERDHWREGQWEHEHAKRFGRPRTDLED
jgi:hypothetical protein